MKTARSSLLLLLLGLLFIVVVVTVPSTASAKRVCFLLVCWDDGESPPAPPPPPPPPPTIQALCDGKKPPTTYVHRSKPNCTNPNDLKRGELVTLKGSYFPPNTYIYEVSLLDPRKSVNHAIIWAPYIGDRSGPPKHPDEYRTNGNGEFTLVVDVPEYQSVRAYSETLPPGVYTYRVGAQNMERVGVNVTLGVTSEPSPPPPPPPPAPNPTPPPPPPAPPSLPSGGNCNTSFPEHKLWVCFFDGIGAPTDASPTLVQYTQLDFPSPASWSQGFKKDWGVGVVDNTKKTDEVSAVWRGKVNFKEGTYDFHTNSDDGIELKLDNSVLISNWNDHAPMQNDAKGIKLSAGFHNVQLRWYDNKWGAAAGLWWDWEPPVSPQPTPEPPAPTPQPSPEPEKPKVLLVEPTRAKPGETVTIVSWPGFPNNIRVNVYFDNTRLKSVMLSPGADAPQIVIPKTAINGQHAVKITYFDGLGATLAGPIEIYGGQDTLQPTLFVDPAAVLAGGTVYIRGSNWTQGEKTVLLVTPDEKQLALEGLENRCTKAVGGGCDADELFYVANIPQDLAAGAYYIMVFGPNQEKAAFEIKVLSVKKPESDKPAIILDPISGKAGTIVAVGGSGFRPKSGMIAKFDSETLTLGRGKGFITDEQGAFVATITVPYTAKPGKHKVSFSTGIAGDYAEAEFIVPGALEEKPIDKKPVEEEPKPEVEKPADKPTDDTQGSKEPEQQKGEPTKVYEGTQGSTYGGVETKAFGNLQIRPFGNVDTKAYGEVQTKDYGSVETKTYGDVPTKDYGDVETKTYGEVQAPTYETPQVKQGDCDPSIPLYSQPGCNKVPLLEEPSSLTAGFFDGFKKFFKSMFGGKSRKTAPTKQQKAPSSESSSGITLPSSESEKQVAPEKTKSSGTRLSGSYRCWSYNVSGGGGGNCRLMAPIVLQQDGTYSMSSEKGTYTIDGDTIYLSESKIRGAGKLLESNMQIRFEYDYNQWHHTITYLREENVAVEPSAPAPSASVAKYVEVTLRIAYPEGDYSADSVNTVTLYSKDGGEQAAQSLAYATDRSTTEAWFSKRSPKKGLLTGQVYKVMVSSGFGEWQVGELDLRNVSQDSTLTIQAQSQ